MLTPPSVRLPSRRRSWKPEQHTPSARAQANRRVRSGAAWALAGALFLLLTAAACTNDIIPRGGWSGPVPSGDHFYFGGADGQVYRVLASTGLLDNAWQYPPGEKATLGAVYGSPVIRDGVVYGAGYSCRGNICNAQVFALDANTSDPAWSDGSYDASTKIAGQVALGTETLVFGTAQVGKDSDPPGYLYALDPQTDAGRPLNEQVRERFKWRLAVDGVVLAGPAVADDVAYFGTMGRTFYAVDLRDEARYEDKPEARVLWSFKTEGAVAGAALIKDGKAYLGDFQGRLYALNIASRKSGYSGPLDSGREEWVFKGSAWFWARPSIEEDVVYAATLGGHVHALDARTGLPVWKGPVRIEGQVVGAPALLETQRGQALAVPSGERDVAVVRLSDGLVLGSLITGSPVKAEPAVSGDFVFVHALDGRFYTFSARNFEMRSCIDAKNGGERCAP